MTRKTITKSDGRLLIFYSFDKPVPAGKRRGRPVHGKYKGTSEK